MASSAFRVKAPFSGTGPLIIIGMHRSGTSFITRLLSELGVYVGRALDSHHESICFKRVNRQLLWDQGAHWARPEPFLRRLADPQFVREGAQRAVALLEQWRDLYGEVAEGELWGWKDPRNTLTLPIWLKVFPSARVLHVVRHGIDVALSLYRREWRRYLRSSRERRMFPPTIGAGYRLWRTYVEVGLRLEQEAPGAGVMRLRYEDMLAHPRQSIESLVRFVGLEVDAETASALVGRIARSPTKPSRWEALWVRLLLGLRGIDPTPLVRLGYDVSWPDRRL